MTLLSAYRSDSLLATVHSPVMLQHSTYTQVCFCPFAPAASLFIHMCPPTSGTVSASGMHKALPALASV